MNTRNLIREIMRKRASQEAHIIYVEVSLYDWTLKSLLRSTGKNLQVVSMALKKVLLSQIPSITTETSFESLSPRHPLRSGMAHSKYIYSCVNTNTPITLHGLMSEIEAILRDFVVSKVTPAYYIVDVKLNEPSAYPSLQQYAELEKLKSELPPLPRLLEKK